METPESPGERLRRLTSPEGASEEETLPPEEELTPPVGLRLPAVDADGMPLPRRVDELDLDATRVTPAAYTPALRPSTASSVTRKHHLSRTGRAAGSAIPPRSTRWLETLSSPALWGCFLRAIIGGLFVFVAVVLLGLAFVIYKYYQIASELPSVDDLRARALQFETTRILDRNGNVLYEINDPSGGKRRYVPLEQISPNVIAATIAIEDKEFYSHKGFDPLAILRAFWQNLRSGETVSGASTITQQLARALLLSPEERASQSYMRKVREAILATEIERRYTKNEILELYLNEIYYGNLAYGIEAAAETYFGKSARDLTVGEAAFLAGLPQAPSVYDIYSARDLTLVRFQTVLLAMMALSSERGCIQVSNSPAPVCVDGLVAANALEEIKNYAFKPPRVEMRYPHWVQYIRTELEKLYDAQTIYRSGFTVYTTLDPYLQDEAQRLVTEQVRAIADLQVTGGALVAIRPATGEILAMVGSPDFYNEEHSGQVNMAVSPTRQPGSSIKPLTYLAAFEKGWSPATLLWDVRTEFPPSGREGDPNPPYIPDNYSRKFWGPVTVRTALANSLNIPAVRTLQFVGVYDDPNTPQPDGLIGMAQRLGITSFTRNDYGLALTLGGGEVSLLELTGAYAVLANGGVRVPPFAISRIENFKGEVVYEYKIPRGEQVVKPQHVFLITSILSDRAARAPVFGYNSILNLPFPSAAKTGTSNDARDNWTLGYTPDLAVGVWVGNPDYTPMGNTTGITGAGPIWAQFMTFAVPYLTGGNPTPFIRPDGIIEQTICAISGTQPSPWCPQQREEYFYVEQPALTPDHDLWKEVLLDTWTRLLASPECSEFTETELVLNVTDRWAIKWITETDQGRKWARDMGFDPLILIPERKCTASDPRPRLEFIGLTNGMTISQSPFEIAFVAQADDGFRASSLDYDAGSGWVQLSSNLLTSPFVWDLSGMSPGEVTLRLRLESHHNDGYAERTVRVYLLPPTPTPTATPTLTPTMTFTPTPSRTPTLTPTSTPTSSPTAP
ncbi:MAG: transglycosylase domain-containing protein [Anaerolineales bacterium]|nr:transglycosylase domain-containing protein [Anaerolineales bacterium]